MNMFESQLWQKIQSTAFQHDHFCPKHNQLRKNMNWH